MLNRSRDKDFAKSCMSRKQNLSGMIGANVLKKIMALGSRAVLAAVVIAACVFIGAAGQVIVLALGGIVEILSQMRIPVYSSNGMVYSYTGGLITQPLMQYLILYLLLFGSITFGAIIGEMLKTPMEVGLRRFYLCTLKNNERPSVICILDGFNHFWGFAKVSVLRWIWILVPSSILFITGLMLRYIPGIAGVMLNILFYILGCVWYFYMWLKTWPIYWIQADMPNYDGDRVMELCKQMTRGHIGDLLIYELSFLGWRILSILTGGIVGLLYSEPYYNMTSALIYAELKGSAISLAPIYQGEGDHGTLGINPLDLTYYERGGHGGHGGGDAHVSSKKPALYGVAGMYKDAKFELTPDQPMLIGRDASICAIVLSNGAEKISRKHCSVMYSSKAGKYEVIDYSSNGTYANGKRIMGNTSVVLPRGTEIMLGNASNVFRLG